MRRLLAGHFRREDSHYDNALAPDQKPVCKNLGRNSQSPIITPKVTYTPVSNRAGSRSA